MIIASNFKTNHTRASTAAYLHRLGGIESDDTILVFPPSTALDRFDLPENIRIGVQNAYPVEKGSFTGEIGLEQIEEFGLSTILIGHSERRHIIGESQELIAEKFAFFAGKGFEIVYCIGEPLEIREAGIESVLAYNREQLRGIDTAYSGLIVAYEPVWAIGTGRTATPEQIEETLSELKKGIDKPLLYGGSVKVENTEEILKLPSCDGILVGTASWNVENFKAMIEIAKGVR